MAATCSKCGAPIIWLKTPRGKWMPVDEGLISYKRNPAGKENVVNQNGEVIRCDLQFDGEPDGMARMPHWATCQFADSFRKKGGRDDG